MHCCATCAATLLGLLGLLGLATWKERKGKERNVKARSGIGFEWKAKDRVVRSRLIEKVEGFQEGKEKGRGSEGSESGREEGS